MKACSVPHLQKKRSELRRDRPQSGPANVYTSRKNKNGLNRNAQDASPSQIMTLELAESYIQKVGPISKGKLSIKDKSPLLSNEFRQLSIEGISSQSEPLEMLNPNWESNNQDICYENGYIDENAIIDAKRYAHNRYVCDVLNCSLKSTAHSLPGQILKDSPKHQQKSVDSLNKFDSITDLEMFLACDYKNDTTQKNPLYSEMTEMKCFSSNCSEEPEIKAPPLVDLNQSDYFHGSSVEECNNPPRLERNGFLGDRSRECMGIFGLSQDGLSKARENPGACFKDCDKFCETTEQCDVHQNENPTESRRQENEPKNDLQVSDN